MAQEQIDKLKYRQLKADIKQKIIEAFQVYGGNGVPENDLLRICADHAIGLLQLPEETIHDWYITSSVRGQ